MKCHFCSISFGFSPFTNGPFIYDLANPRNSSESGIPTSPTPIWVHKYNDSSTSDSNSYHATFVFLLKCILLFTSSAHQTSFFFMEANNMNPNQTAPSGSSLIWAHIVCSIGYLRKKADEKKQTIKIVTGRYKNNLDKRSLRIRENLHNSKTSETAVSCSLCMKIMKGVRALKGYFCPL